MLIKLINHRVEYLENWSILTDHISSGPAFIQLIYQINHSVNSHYIQYRMV